MDDGQISAIGTHDELLRTSDIYRETYTSQNKQSHDQRMDSMEDADATVAASSTRGEAEAHE